MPIDPEYINVPFRQVTLRLRVQRGAGRPDLVSERPHTLRRDGRGVIFTDSADAPTVVTFDAHCQVDVAALLQVGAIMPYAPAVSVDGEGAADGEIPGE